MIQHVWERCSRAQSVDRVIVATEDQRIVDGCRAFGAECELTAATHASGTDRVAEIASRYPDFECVVNVQGDEPGIDPETVGVVAAALRDETCQISTAISRLDNEPDLLSPNVVKVVTAASGQALYFSRSPIPFQRDRSAEAPAYFRHMGIYGFRRPVLFDVTRLPMSPLERAESLEQLRWMQAGYRLQCVEVRNFSIGVDTPDDLKSVEVTFKA